MPYYQSGLKNWPCYEITFSEYRKVISASGQSPSPDATYKIKDIMLEYQIATQLDLGRNISEEYQKHRFVVWRKYQAQYDSSE